MQSLVNVKLLVACLLIGVAMAVVIADLAVKARSKRRRKAMLKALQGWEKVSGPEVIERRRLMREAERQAL